MRRLFTTTTRFARPRDYIVQPRHLLVALLLSLSMPDLLLAVMTDI